MEENQLFKRNPDYIYRRIVDEYVLVPTHQNVANMECIYTLNDVGALIWEMLESPASFQKLVSTLKTEFDVEEETLLEDLRAFLSEMEVNGAIMKVDD